MQSCPHCQYLLSPDATSCPACGAAVAQLLEASPELQNQITELLGQGHKLEAVKAFKDALGCSLSEAKVAVEAFATSTAGNLPPGTEPLSAALEAELLRLLERGEKIQAVKAYKEQTGVSLRIAKDFVDSFAQQRGLRTESKGCGGAAAALLLPLVLAALALMLAFLPT
ncbi:MAG TPA: hypothetical protein DCY79_16980 [Planctomycetaceae bacterium]|nr:hypothetical protein [Blastopirellula sp.]HAY81501.1 hypothetical protein [Planctomycetaceae bacterium]